MQRATQAVAWWGRRRRVLLALGLGPLLAACSTATHQATSHVELPLTGASPTAVPAAAPPHGTVILSLTSPVTAGGRATLTAAAVPHAACRASVTYGERGTAPTAIGGATATAAGRVAWTWAVSRRAPAGTWPVTVACTPGGTAATLLTVR